MKRGIWSEEDKSELRARIDAGSINIAQVALQLDLSNCNDNSATLMFVENLD